MNTKKTIALILAFLFVCPMALGMYDFKAFAADETVNVTAVGETQLDLSWEAYPGASLYLVFYTTEKDATSYQSYVFTYTPSLSLKDLKENTQYWYMIVPNANATARQYGTGTTGQSSAASTESPAPTATTEPTATESASSPSAAANNNEGTLNEDLNLEIEVLSYTELKLTWSELDGYEEYNVWKYGENGYELMDTLEKTKWEDEGLEPGTTYQYMVSTSDDKYYMEASGMTMSYAGAGCEDEYPVIKIWQRKEGNYTRLTWSDVDADEYYVLRSEEQDSFDWIDDRIHTVEAGQQLTYLDTDTSRQYYYLIVANIKTCSEFVDYALDLTVSNSTSDPYTSLVLNWTDSSNAGSYEVFRSPNGTNWESRTTTNGLTYTDTGLTAGTTYFYKVVASNSLEDIDSGTTRKQDVLTLTVTNNTADPYTRLNLSWTDTSNATSYTVQRSLDNNNWTDVTSTSVRNIIDTGLNPGTTYYYKVKANTGIEGTNSGTTRKQDVLTLTVTNNTTDPYTRLNLSWTDTSNATSYTVQRSLNNYNWTTIATTSARTRTDTGLTPNTTYYYKVIANTGIQGTNYGKTKAKLSLSVYVNPVSSSQLLVTWTRVTGERTYKLERALSQYGPFTTVATNLTGTYYQDSGLKADTIYWYRVTSSPNSYSGINSGKTLPEPKPVGPGAPDFWLTSGSNEETTVYWSWRNLSKPHPQYNIYISENASGPYRLVYNYRPNVAGAKLGELYYSINQKPYNPQRLVYGKKYFIKMSTTDASGKEGPMSNYYRYFYAFLSLKKEGFGTPPSYHYTATGPWNGR